MRYTAGFIALIMSSCVHDQSAHSSPNYMNALPPVGHTVFCMKYPADCESTAATTRLPATSENRYRQLVTVNRQVNGSIHAMPAYESNDALWLIAPAEGDCTDYAVTKRHELLQAGWPSSSLLLAEVTLPTGEHHLLLIVKGTDTNWVLDNLRHGVPRLADIKNQYVWNRVEMSHNPKFWTKSFSELI